MIPHLAQGNQYSCNKFYYMRNQGPKPANFSTKPLAETQWKLADTFKSTEALRKHEIMPPFSSYTFLVETVLRKHNGILNYQVSATFPNCGNTLFHHVILSWPLEIPYWQARLKFFCSIMQPNIHTLVKLTKRYKIYMYMQPKSLLLSLLFGKVMREEEEEVVGYVVDSTSVIFC